MKNLLFFAALAGFYSCAPAVWQLAEGQADSEKLRLAFAEAETNKTAKGMDKWLETQRDYIYAGVPNRLKILDGGVPTVSIGKIQADSLLIGYYTLQVDAPNTVVELKIADMDKLGTDKSRSLMLSVLPLPMPEWRIAGLQNGKMLAKDLRKLRNFELVSTAVGEKSFVIGCSCLGFNLLKIDQQNNRTSASSAKGDFNPEVQNLLNSANAGDLFLIQQLKTACSETDKVRMMQTLAIEVI